MTTTHHSAPTGETAGLLPRPRPTSDGPAVSDPATRMTRRSRLTPWERSYIRALVLLDAGLLGLAAVLGYVLRFGAVSAGSSHVTTAAAWLLAPAWLAAIAVEGAYEARHLGVGTMELRRVTNASLRVAAAVASVSFITKSQISRGFVLIAIPLGLAMLLAGRVAARAVLHRLRRQGRCEHRVVAVGAVEDVVHLIEQAGRAPQAGFDVVAACIVQDADGLHAARTDLVIDGREVPVLGGPADVLAVLRDVDADTIAVTTQDVLGRQALRELCWQLEGDAVHLLVAPALTDVAGPRLTIRPLAGLPLLHVDQPSFTGVRRLFKGTTDRLLAVLGLIALSPVMLTIAVLIRRDSKGPVFFRQTRVGLGGRKFTCWKFRTMRVGADLEVAQLADRNEHDGLMFKIRNDPRVTRVGQVLRRYSLDELPQLFNVVLGSMSLVGPRPPLVTEAEQYADDVRRRLLVKPGLTGLWQVSGRSDLPWEEAVRLDLYYVENWSPVLDASILVRTVTAVLASRGAY